VDSDAVRRASQLTQRAFEGFPDYTGYGNLSLMRLLSVLANENPEEFGTHLETLGQTLLDQYPYNPYANIYLAYYQQALNQPDQAMPYFSAIAEAPNFRPFWYTLEALFFLGQYHKEKAPELAVAYFQRIVEIGWNMGGVVDKAQRELDALDKR